MEEKIKCQELAESTPNTISLANRLVGGLASENIRWSRSVKDLQQKQSMLPGDILLSASFISYLGAFTKQLDLQCHDFPLSSDKSPSEKILGPDGAMASLSFDLGSVRVNSAHNMGFTDGLKFAVSQWFASPGAPRPPL